MEHWKVSLQNIISNLKVNDDIIVIPEDLDIVSIVESLQPFMTNFDSEIRIKAATILKKAIFTKFDAFDKDTLSVLKQFIVLKLDDAAVVLEFLTILSWFCEKNVLEETEVFSICVQALKFLKAFRYGVENRHGIFKFIHVYLQNSKEFDQQDYELFYETFLSAIESEKDPRNLVIIFDCIHLLNKAPMSVDYIEEFFEAIFCYFPISFRSNPSDPTLITVNELKSSLGRVISGDARFGDLAIPSLIDKLASNSISAKMDALDVLLKAASVFEPISFTPHRYLLEVSLFAEITANPDAKIQSKALELIRNLAVIFDKEEAPKWMNKFLKEAITAVELDSREVMSKSGLLIDAIASSNINNFDFAVNYCAEFLLKISQNEASNIKGQASRNCLVALFSPIKANPSWIECISENIINGLNNFFNSFNGDLESYCIYLVIFSFINEKLSSSCRKSFVEKFFNSSSRVQSHSNELKNCIWLASSSCPPEFIIRIDSLENGEIICACASNSNLTVASLKRLLVLNELSYIEELISKSDLSESVLDQKLVHDLVALPLSPVSIIKLVSKCSKNIQKYFIEQNIKLELIIIAALPETIEECKLKIMAQVQNINNPHTIASLYNKCPMIDWPFSRDRAELELSAIRGLVYRKDLRSLDSLKISFGKFDANCFAKMFSSDLIPELFISSETHHTKSLLYLQWLLNYLLPNCDSFKPVALLVSVISICPSALINLHSNILPELVLTFLKFCDDSSNEIESKVREEAWRVLVNLLEHSGEVKVDELIEMALRHCSLKLECYSLIRYWSLKLLSKLIETRSFRASCYDWQSKVISTLKSGPIDDPKRAVRLEAARAINLWIVLKEDGVFS